MRRLCWLLLLLLSSPAWATTYYVDPGCPTAGDGTSSSCLASPTTNNPKTTIAAGLALLTGNDGDILNVSGVHAAHDNCPGTNGEYVADLAMDVTQDSTAGNEYVVQAKGWTAIGARTQEKVYLINGATPSWTQCTWDGSACDCDPTSFQNVQIGAGGQTACEETWWYNGAIASGVEGARKLTREPTHGVCSNSMCVAADDPCDCCTGSGTGSGCGTADITNSHSHYNASRCSDETWRVCSTAADCPGGGSCTAAYSPEVDHLSCTNTYGGCATGVILVRWGTGTDCADGYCTPTSGGSTREVFSSSNGPNIRVNAANYVIVRGFITFPGRDDGISVQGASSNVSIVDNVIAYGGGASAGGNLGISLRAGATPVTVQGNEVMHVASEPISVQNPGDTDARVYTIVGNYFHHIGDRTVVGAEPGSTPTCSTFNVNVAGSIFEKNLVTDCYHLNFENHASGWIVRNNIVSHTYADCTHHAPGAADTNSTYEYYNNYFIDCGQAIRAPRTAVFGGQAGFLFDGSAGGTMTGYTVYNNTVVNPRFVGIKGNCTGTCTGFVFRNNVIHSGAIQSVDFQPSDASNLWEFNDTYRTSGTVVGWKGANYTCAQINAGDMPGTDNDKCSDPLFAGASDFHLTSSSPAKDSGTSTGMPAGRMLDICNALAAAHGLANYNDCQAASGTVDMGADEFQSAAKRRILVINP